MIWLAAHIWVLLFLAFLLGLLIGWWIWGRVSLEQAAYAEPIPVPQPLPVAEPIETIDDPEESQSVKPKLYETPSRGPADDLKKISGIGPKYEILLNELGIWYYDQIASWTPDEINWLDDRLEFPGRIKRDRWQEQARILGAGESTEFAARYEEGETPSSYKKGSPKHET
ncbi:MAG: hypothetical protein ACWA5L_11055 [bacterium]